MPHDTLRLYFENPVGRLLEQSNGRYIIVEYHPGPRQLSDLQAFLGHAGRLLELRHWHKLLGDQRRMQQFTPEESQWITGFWLNSAERHTEQLYGAVLLPTDVLARLSVSQLMHEARAAAMTYRLFEQEQAAIDWLMELA